MDKIPRNEYPRPSFVKDDRMNFNGICEFTFDRMPKFDLPHLHAIRSRIAACEEN